MLEIVNCPKCRTRMRSYMVDTAGAHYRCDFCGFLYPEDVHVTYGTSTTHRYIDANIIKFTEPLKISRKDSRSLQKTVLNLALQYAKEAVDAIPDADVRPVGHAHWIEEDDGWGNIYYSCSNCREPWDLAEGTPEDNRMNYCPTCGYIMDEEVTE